MQRPDFALPSAPPDLLHRFVQTPYKAICRIAEVPVLVQTNDITLLPPFPLEGNFVLTGEELFAWRLVRDTDMRESPEPPVILNCKALTIVHMGPGCLLALDQQRRELLGFIGAGIDNKTYQEFLIPFMHGMMDKAFPAQAAADVVRETAGFLYD